MGMDEDGLSLFAQEFAIVFDLNHSNLLRPTHYDAYNRQPYLVMPYCQNGSTLKLIGKMSEEQAWCFLRDVAAGLDYLHGKNPPIIHQDIKPDNILINDEGHYVITDFGISTRIRSTLRKSVAMSNQSAGTLAYMGPERFSATPQPIKASDVYSLGATMYELLTGDAPFGEQGGLLQKSGAEIPDIKGKYSDALKDIIRRCLAKDAWDRPTAKEVSRYAQNVIDGVVPDADSHDDDGKKKKVLLWSSIAAVAVATVLLAVVLFTGSNGKQAEPAPENAAEASNPDFQKYADCMRQGDSLMDLASSKEGYYEDNLVKAYNSYKQAESLSSSLPDDKAKADLDEKMKNINQSMTDTYKQFEDKAKQMDDIGEVNASSEFRMRADKIKNVNNTIQ
jgi:serine/threonine protein kinase